MTLRTPAGDTPPCRLCGGPTAFAFTTRDFNRRLTAQEFVYVRCTRCGTLSLANLPRDLGAFYPPDYYALPSTRAALMSIGAEAEREKLALVRRFVSSGRLVEVGPGAGAFVAVSQDAGYQVEAIEMDGAACRFLESELRVPTTCSDDPAAVLKATGPFDVIAMWQVIEHVADPAGVIAAAAEALARGGVLALSAPNPEAWQYRIFARRWTHVDAPRHLALMPHRALSRIGAESGLETIFVTTSDHAARGWNRFGWRESLANLVRWPPAASFMRILGSVLVRLLAPYERRGDRGATYTLILRRGQSERD